jgi:hypothetical protein
VPGGKQDLEGFVDERVTTSWSGRHLVNGPDLDRTDALDAAWARHEERGSHGPRHHSLDCWAGRS